MLVPIGLVSAALGSGVVLLAKPTKKRARDTDDDRVASREERRTRRADPGPVEGELPPLPKPAFTVAPMPTFSTVLPVPVPSPSVATPASVSVSIGGASVSGGTVSNAGAVVARMAAGFRACYRRALKADPSMRGTVRVTAKVGPSGEVQAASASGGGSLSNTLVGCVQARVAGAQFAAPTGGSATIVIPITFDTP